MIMIPGESGQKVECVGNKLIEAGMETRLHSTTRYPVSRCY